MNCYEALELISGHLDENNTPEEEAALQAHLACCDQCRSLLLDFKQTEVVLSSMKEPAPSDLCDGVMVQIRKETRKKARRRWNSLAVAAVLVLVIGAAAAVKPEQVIDEPQMATATSEAYVMSRSLPSQDGETVAKQISQIRGASVAVVHEMYHEIESYPCETLEEGYLLYVLPDHDAAVFLSETYGCAIYGAQDAEVHYAMLVP